MVIKKAKAVEHPVTINYNRHADVIRVIDGDTMLIRTDLSRSIHVNETLRLARVQCPELLLFAADAHGAKVTNPKGTAAKDFTNDAVYNRQVIITTIKVDPENRHPKDRERKDNYGRYLAEVYYIDNGVQKNLGDELLAAGHAVLWQGKAKKK